MPSVAYCNQIYMASFIKVKTAGLCDQLPQCPTVWILVGKFMIIFIIVVPKMEYFFVKSSWFIDIF